MSLTDIFPTDLAVNHLQRTWLYWALLSVLLLEFLWMRVRTMRFLAGLHPKGPWDTTPAVSPFAIRTAKLHLWISAATLIALALASAVAFYVAVLPLLTALARFAVEIPHARGGEAIGGAIGSWIGASLQALLIIGAIATVDPTSSFPLRLDGHLTEST